MLLLLSSLTSTGTLSPASHITTVAEIEGASPTSIGTLLGSAPANLAIAASIGFFNNTLMGLRDQMIESIYTPGSYMYHSFLTPDQYSAVFAPSPALYASAVSYFQSYGISTYTDRSRLFLNLVGTVAQFDQAFGTNIQMFSALHFKFYANTAPVYLPSNYAPYVTSVIGLENYTFFVPTLAAQKVTPTGTSPIPPFSPPYQPSDLQNAYNETSLLKSGLDGKGQTIVLIDAGYGDKTIQADLAEFSLTYNLPTPIVNIQTVNSSATIYDVTNDAVNGVLSNFPVTGGLLGVPPGSGWDTETALDVEWAHAMAPGAALTNMLSFDPGPGLSEAIATAITSQAGNIISQSFGEYEGSNDGGANSTASSGIGTASLIAYTHSFYAEADIQGITVLASSGDWGNTCPGMNNFDVGACYPASDPLVTSVGGTNLNVGSTGWKAESTWTCDPGCTGGAYSSVFTRPTWQTGPGVSMTTTGRGVPDIAADADPQTGVVIVLNGVNFGLLFLIGGTSLASPLWAGAIAMIDNARNTNAGFFNPEIYNILNSSQYLPIFHDITTGNNCFQGTPCYNAGPGWDPVTGIGSPNLGCIVSGCVPKPVSTGITITSPTTGQNVASTTLTVTGTHSLPPLNWLVGKPNSAPGYFTGQQQDQLNILKGFIDNYRVAGLSGYFNVNLVMSNLTNILLPPAPSEGEWWVLQWDFNGQSYFAVMTLYGQGGISVSGAGTSIAGIAFQYGTISNVAGSNNYQATALTNGTYTGTAPGKITITVPTSGVGSPSLGSFMTNVRATTFEVVGTPLLASLQSVDSIGTVGYNLGDSLLPNGYVQVALNNQFVGAVTATLINYPATSTWTAKLNLAGLPSGSYAVYARQVVNGTPGLTTTVQFTLTSPAQPSGMLLVQTNNIGYNPGSFVKLSGTLKTPAGIPLTGRTVGVEVDNSRGGPFFIEQLSTNSKGAYSTSFTLPSNPLTGSYTVLAASSGLLAKTTFSVGTAQNGPSIGSSTGFISGSNGSPTVTTTVQILNDTWSPQSTFTNGQTVVASVALSNPDSQAQSTLAIAEFIGPRGIPVFIGGGSVTLQAGQTVTVTFSVTIGTTIPFGSGKYIVLALAWNGFVALQGSSWNALANTPPSSNTFQVK